MNKFNKKLVACAAALLAAGALAGCDDDNDSSAGGGGGGSANIVTVNDAGEMVRFSSATPGTVTRLTLAGLAGSESIVSMDVDPFTKVLYAVADGGAGGPRLVTITIAGTTATVNNVGDFNQTLTPSGQYDIDFNPSATERIRYVDSGGENARINSTNGATAAADPGLTYAAGDAGAGTSPVVAGLAYTASVLSGGVRPAPNATTAYAIDAGADRLVLVGSVNATPDSPNTGTLRTVGALGFDMFLSPFDIGASDQAFAASFLPGGTAPRLFSINLTSGAATNIGAIGTAPGGTTSTIRALAILQ